MASDVLESVRELLPIIRERATRTEAERAIPEETVARRLIVDVSRMVWDHTAGARALGMEAR